MKVLIIIYMVFPLSLWAQIPINDEASNAILLTVNAGCNILYDNTNATQSTGEPLASCSDNGINPNTSTNQHIMWFKFIAPSCGAVRISTEHADGGTLSDTQIALFSVSDSSDYSTFQIITCDDDANVSPIAVRSICYAAGLMPGGTYYILLDGWVQSSIGTYCITVDELDNTMISTDNSCSSAYPNTWASSNPNYEGWIPLLDNMGHIVMNIRNPMGGVAFSFHGKQNINTGAVRQMPNGAYYLDRGFWASNTQSATNIDFQFFFLTSELDALNAAGGTNAAVYDLHVIQQDAGCQADYNSALEGTELPQTGCTNELVGQCGDIAWVTATTPTFPSASSANFYLVPGPPLDTISVASYIEPCFPLNNEITLSLANAAGINYVWNNGDTGSSKTVTASGTYWVTYRNISPPCNYHVDTFHVSFPYGVLPHIRTDTACAGMANGSAYAFTYTGDTVAYHYVWTNTGGDTLSLSDSLSGITAGDYILHIATASCDTTLNITIPAINDKVSFTVSDTLVCTSESLTFQNTSASGYTQFLWQFGDSSTSEDYSPIYQYENSGAYMACLIGHGSICSDTACRSIMVDAPVDSFSFHPDRTLLCTGEHIVLDAVTDSTLAGYDWSFGDESMLYTDKSTTEHAYDKDGIYIISLTGKFRACPDITLNDSIRVYPFPVVRLGQDSVLCLGSSPIHLENLTVNAGGTCHYEWSTGDTTESMEIRHPDIYSLTVTQEPAGCASTDVVTVSKDCYIDIPNAFTPNGDGVNDYFFPRQYLSRSVTQFRMQVLNRWGQKVFETTSIEGRGWDGRFNDKEQPAGVYMYIIDVTLDNNRQEHYEGNVTLLR